LAKKIDREGGAPTRAGKNKNWLLGTKKCRFLKEWGDQGGEGRDEQVWPTEKKRRNGCPEEKGTQNRFTIRFCLMERTVKTKGIGVQNFLGQG